MDRCPHCKLPLGRILDCIEPEFNRVTYEAHMEGQKATLEAYWENRDISEIDCPYNDFVKPLQHFAWIAGMHYILFKMLLKPDKIAEWAEKAGLDDNDELTDNGDGHVRFEVLEWLRRNWI